MQPEKLNYRQQRILCFVLLIVGVPLTFKLVFVHVVAGVMRGWGAGLRSSTHPFGHVS